MTGTPPEALIEWLEALEVPIEDTVTIERFQSRIGRFLNAKTLEGRERQSSALTEAMMTKYERMLPTGIRPKLFEFTYGTQLRFFISNFRGAFGLKGMQEKIGQSIEAMWYE